MVEKVKKRFSQKGSACRTGKNTCRQAGFTLIEMIMVFGVLAVLMGFISPNFLRTQQKTDINTTVTTLVSDMKSQQLKSMTGAGNADEAYLPYGIHFDETGYTLFRGDTYSPGSSNNYTVSLNSVLRIEDILVSDSNIIFSPVSGDFTGFASGEDSFKIRNTTNNDERTILLNRYGTVISVQ